MTEVSVNINDDKEAVQDPPINTYAFPTPIFLKRNLVVGNHLHVHKDPREVF